MKVIYFDDYTRNNNDFFRELSKVGIRNIQSYFEERGNEDMRLCIVLAPCKVI